MKPYFDLLNKLSNNQHLRKMFSSEYFYQTRSFEITFIITDFLINGNMVFDHKYSVTNPMKNILPAILRDRREVINSIDGLTFIKNLEQTLETAINDVYRVFGDIMFIRPNIDKKYAKITFYKGAPSLLASVFELLTVYYARKYNKDLIYHRKNELRHEAIITFLKLFPQNTQTYSQYGNFLRMKKAIIDMVKRLLVSKSSTYYDRSPKELKEFLWELYISKNGKKPICPYCGREITNIDESHLSHIEPFSITKNSDILNIVIAHKECNEYARTQKIEFR